jgi:hypothetical protein
MGRRFDSEEDQLAAYESDLMSQAQNANAQQYNPSMFAGQQKQNLVEWELDFKNDLEDIERLLRCDVLSRDKDGNQIWIPNPDPSKVFMNDLGVNDLLRKIILLVNKNKVLSNYTIEEIKPRIRMIEQELRVLIYNNYEKYGMDNEYKMNNYSMIVLTIGAIIEDTYRRAMGGSAHKGLNEQRLVTQNEPLMPQGYGGYSMRGNSPGGKKHLLMPWTWNR